VECKTDRNGTEDAMFYQVVRSYFPKTRKHSFSLDQLDSLLESSSVIMGYEYFLSSGEIEGHFSLVWKKLEDCYLMVNHYNYKDVDLITKESRARYFKTINKISREEFENYFNIDLYSLL